MKNMYANVCKAVNAGAVKVFVVGYVDGDRFYFTEAGNLAAAKCIYVQMKAEGHKPGIDVYTR